MGKLDVKPILTVLNDNFSAESQKIISAINPENVTPIELWKKLDVISKEEMIDDIKMSSRDNFIVLFTDYSDEQAHEIYLFTKRQAVLFISENFDEDKEEGLDIVMCDDLYNVSYLGNHDGILLKRSNLNSI